MLTKIAWRMLGIAVKIACASKCAAAFVLRSPRPDIVSRPRVSGLRVVTLDVTEGAPREVSAFEEWAACVGIQRSDGFRLVAAAVDHTGFLDVSAATTEDVTAGSPVVFVPSDRILSAHRAMEEFGGCLGEIEELLSANGYGLDLRQYYLLLKVLAEAEKGQESDWFPYLNALPRYYSNGAAMTPFCFSVVPPLVARLCKDERARFKNFSLGKRGIPFLSAETKGNEELWKWAYQVVYTRGFETNNGSGDFCLAPMADMFNHGTEANVELAYDNYGNCYAQTTQDVLANTPLCMSYGDPTNPSFLLSRYGFLDQSSPATFCKLLPSHVSEEMINLGYAHNTMLFYKDTGDVSEQVWDVLLHMALDSDPATQQQFYQAHMNGDYATKQAIHERCYALTATKLAEHIQAVLHDLEELQRKGGGDIVAHPRLPLIMRHNEFVRDTFLAVQSRQGLGSNNYAQ